MQFCIHKDVIGESFHLFHDKITKKFKWVDEIPNDVWCIGENYHDLNVFDLARLSGIDFQLAPPDNYNKVFSTLTSSEDNAKIKMRHSMPKRVFSEFINRLVDDSEMIINKGNIEYYKSVFFKTKRLLSSMEHASIDKDRLYGYYNKEKNETTRSTLKSFFPKNGFSEVVSYNQTSTITGRLTVDQGPRILTLPREYRDIITTSYDPGSVFMIDLVSLEPRIALIDAGRDVPLDVYDDINQKLFGAMFERKRTKIMTISALYGAQEEKFIEVSELSEKDARDSLDSLRTHFGIRLAHARLKKQLNDNGYITNMFGRIIKPKKESPRILYNYFIQSTAVDIALLCFDNLVQFTKKMNLRVKPLFVIHDAIIFDIHSDDEQYIDKMLECLKIDNLNVLIPATYERINNVR